MIDTGVDTLTGGRIKKVCNYLKDEDYFFVNYSDGVADINLDELLYFHRRHGKIATLTTVQKHGKFGAVQLDDNQITSFKEKPLDDNWINGGFFVFSEEIFDYLSDGDLSDTLELLAKENQLMAYKHYGEWECMDTIRDRQVLENLWNLNKAFWKSWE